MTTLTHAGKSHRILSALNDGPKPSEVLFEAAIGLNPTRRTRNKAWYAFRALVEHDLIFRTKGGVYHLTDDGDFALSILNSGRDYFAGEAAPSVRVFEGRAA